MAPHTINVLLSSFPGLRLPSTLCIPVSSDSPISALTSHLSELLPSTLSPNLLLTTSSSKIVQPLSCEPISSLCPSADLNASILSLRLSSSLCGGKGGFGSQLRAAGGRMSSRKKRAQGENNGSNRNLDGRRLRTVTEAKALAEYLAVKPEMAKKEKEERRKRWEQVVEAADKRKADIKNGQGKGRVDGKWVEEKEEAESRTREAVAAAMRKGLLRDHLNGMKRESDESAEGTDSDSESESEVEQPGDSSSKDTTPPSGSDAQKHKARKVFGWDDDEDDDEDDEDMSESDEDDLQQQQS